MRIDSVLAVRSRLRLSLETATENRAAADVRLENGKRTAVIGESGGPTPITT